MRRKIIIDTRERKPWSFSKLEWIPGCEHRCLKTGDYSLEGLEEIFTIDRKAKIGELAQNLLSKRFERELERMQSFKHAFIVCDFDISDVQNYPFVDSMPSFLKKKIRVRGAYLMSILNRFKEMYTAQWVFSEKGKRAALNIIKDMDLTYNV